MRRRRRGVGVSVGVGPALGRRGGVWGRLDRCGCGWLFCARLAFRPASWCSLEMCGFRRVCVGACVGVSRSVVVVHLSMWLRLGVGLRLACGEPRLVPSPNEAAR